MSLTTWNSTYALKCIQNSDDKEQSSIALKQLPIYSIYCHIHCVPGELTPFLKRLFLCHKHSKTTYYVVLACMWHKNSHFKKSVNSPGTQCIVGTIRFRILKSYIRTKFYVLCFQKIQSKELGLWGNFAFTTYFFSALSLATGGVYFIHLKNCGRFRSVLQITNVSLDYLLFVLCHKSILQRILKNPEPSYIFIAFFDQRTLGRFCSTYPSENQMFLILHHFVSKWTID